MIVDDPFGTPRLVLVMVGLPARGKTYTAQQLSRFLTWRGHKTRVFNVGEYRRASFGAQQSHEFFDPDNVEGARQRLDVAMTALDDLLGWLAAGGEVAIYDATNSTERRRRLVRQRCEAAGYQVRFIETICNDREVIERNIVGTKLASPDYEGVAPEEAVSDFRARIAHYERAYEPLGEDEASYVKLVDFGRQVVVNRIHGHLGSRVVYFLMNVHTEPRPLWLTRHGESKYNVRGLLGGDSDLTEQGQAYAARLREHCARHFGADELVVFSSDMRRTRHTAAIVGRPVISLPQLDEINAGDCDGMTYEEIRRELPDEYAARKVDKFGYRYPMGESYRDMVKRVEPVMIEMERSRRPVLVIAHQAVLRVIYAYFMGLPPAECVDLTVPLHTVIKLTPKAYGCDATRTPLEPD